MQLEDFAWWATLSSLAIWPLIRDILKLQMKHVMTFHMVCIRICVLTQPIYLLQLVLVTNSIYQQSVQKKDHFHVEMDRNGEVRVKIVQRIYFLPFKKDVLVQKLDFLEYDIHCSLPNLPSSLFKLSFYPMTLNIPMHFVSFIQDTDASSPPTYPSDTVM